SSLDAFFKYRHNITTVHFALTISHFL
uniref:Uncharacterized protein n=1 Tax=Amphimedon queenslandica TaxID=400682 RepID=A0A1X7TGM0_AMPQE